MKELIQIIYEYEIQYETPAGRLKAVGMAVDGALDSFAWFAVGKEELVKTKRIAKGKVVEQ